MQRLTWDGWIDFFLNYKNWITLRENAEKAVLVTYVNIHHMMDIYYYEFMNQELQRCVKSIHFPKGSNPWLVSGVNETTTVHKTCYLKEFLFRVGGKNAWTRTK